MDRIARVNELFHEVTSLLPMIYDIDGEVEDEGFVTDPDGDVIFSAEDDVNTIADLFDQLFGVGTCVVGRISAKRMQGKKQLIGRTREESKFPEDNDAYTGLYYVHINDWRN